MILGSGAIPLAMAADRREFVAAAASEDRRALANNRYSADVVAIARAGETLADVPDLAGDNALPRWLDEVAGYAVGDLRRRWRLAVDIDGPLDVVLTGGGDVAGEAAATTPSTRSGLERVGAISSRRGRPSAERVVAGRMSAATVRWLERRTARGPGPHEERGMRTSVASGPAASAPGASSATGRIARGNPLASATRRSSTPGSLWPIGSAPRKRPGRGPRTGLRRTCCSPTGSPILLRALTASAAAARSRSRWAGTSLGAGCPSRERRTRRAPHGADSGLRRDPAPVRGRRRGRGARRRIRDEIRRDGPMPFVRYMDLALYDPAGGYYRGPEARPGRAGDFITAPEAHPIFGRAVARVLDETWRRLGEPARFVVREHGAGDGTLALAILDGLRREGSGLERASRTSRSRSSRAARGDRLATGDAGWADILTGPAAVAEPIVGAVLGNEVLDALPVHRVRRREDALVELAVGLDGEQLVEVEIEPTTPALGERLVSEGVELVDGQTAEICLALDRWVGDAAAGLARGLLLLIDYGAIATELYDPVRRRDGTLRAYLRHRVHDDPYRHVGRQPDGARGRDRGRASRAAGGLEHPRR